jgi:hypothetical protein
MPLDLLIPGQRPDARPDIVSRVFRLKVGELVSGLKKGSYFGKACAGMINNYYTTPLCFLFGK